jgi:hypothetical protein
MPEKSSPTRNEQAAETPVTTHHGEDVHSSGCAEGHAVAEEGDKEHRIVKEWHVKEDLLDCVELIRSLQRTEGNLDCFKKKTSCDEMECAWRSYCLTGPLASQPE